MRRTFLARHTRAASVAAALLATPLVPQLAAAEDPASEPEAVEVETGQEMEIRALIEQRLRRNEFLEPYDIRAEVEGNDVTLRGAVTADFEKEQAGEIARSVDGVDRVTNEVLVGKGLGDEADVGTLTAPQRKGRGLRGGSGIQ